MTFCCSRSVFVCIGEASPNLQRCAAFHEAVGIGLPVPLLPLTSTNEVWDPHKPHMPVHMRLMWEASCWARG